MKIIDLRSDTVTHPTPAMREAMYRAEVGDDVFGDDPTVNRLEALAAEMLGKEAALFVASGTMGNLVALLTHCGRGDEAIVGDRSHTFLFEQGGMAALGGITPRTISNQPDGTLRLEEIEGAIRGDNVHFPRTRLVCLENTHNMCNGAPLTVEYTAQAAELAHERGLQLHLDGARVFNAAAALGVDVREVAREADSVMFCLSKGLCAPVGSLVCGDADFIAQARRARKVVGGGMRQAGVLAAAGIVALEQIAPRMAEDHVRAKRLADGLAQIPGVEVAPAATNILYFWLTEETPKTQDEVVDGLRERGVLLLGRLDGRFRAVTHYWITDEAIEHTIQAMRETLKVS
ncbi:MAG: low-specificity L-threonine aldolase [Chloroflexi bacterium]|nr:MAG: low-specificity L-threonine aldolase [Chloroflexota bacterium]RLC85502.1 MAG: low-specificity L-threonine aldolase [Chloroflexota bacterium]HEY73676.1 low-specificity L-threonine aldolase [Thermoflexia bacterium]